VAVSASGSRIGLKGWKNGSSPIFFCHDSQSDSYVSQVVPKYEHCGEICYSVSPQVVLM
jgi:hypothetical protein